MIFAGNSRFKFSHDPRSRFGQTIPRSDRLIQGILLSRCLPSSAYYSLLYVFDPPTLDMRIHSQSHESLVLRSFFLYPAFIPHTNDFKRRKFQNCVVTGFRLHPKIQHSLARTTSMQSVKVPCLPFSPFWNVSPVAVPHCPVNFTHAGHTKAHKGSAGVRRRPATNPCECLCRGCYPRSCKLQVTKRAFLVKTHLVNLPSQSWSGQSMSVRSPTTR